MGWVSRSAAWWWWWWGEPLCTLVNPDKLSSMDAIPVTLQTREGRDIRKCLLLVYIDRQELALLSHTSASSPHSPSSKQGSAIGYGAATNLVKMVHAAFVFFQEKSRNKEEVNHSLQWPKRESSGIGQNTPMAVEGWGDGNAQPPQDHLRDQMLEIWLRNYLLILINLYLNSQFKEKYWYFLIFYIYILAIGYY